eukprot:8984_1
MSDSLLIILSLLCIDFVYSFTCSTSIDCELNGKCIDNQCKCNPGWKGESCSSLNLTTAPYPNLGVWPLQQAHDQETCYSWGFSVIKGISDNLYHAYANAGCYNISDKSQKQVNGSFLLHVTSNSPSGPFKSADITMPITSFNPHIIYSNSMKKYLLFFRINDLIPMPYCYGNETIFTDIYNYNLTANTMDVAVSDSPYGPWDVSIITIENMPGTHISNPSAIELANGTFVLSYRFNTNTEHIGIAVSKNDYKGPYVNIANLSVTAEDPYFWQNKIDGSFHMIFHAMSSAQHHSQWPSSHAFTMDLYNWSVSESWNNFGVGCYSTNVTWSDESVTTFYRRERPEILFDKNGNPQYFYSAVQQFANDSHFGYSYSVLQDIGR